MKKSGFVTLVGRSNVGKSTLLNALVGTKVAIVTPKPQTTRRPVRGMLNDARGQIVFVDTPGIFQKKDALSLRLNKSVHEQLEGVEAIVYVVDPTREPGQEEQDIQAILKRTEVPIVLAINKSDLPEEELPALMHARMIDIGQRATLEISAVKRQNLNLLVDALFDLLPEGEPYYPDLQMTDMERREWLSELIREKVFLRLDEELPYSVHVVVDEDELRENGVRHIAARILTSELRYKKMIIGAQGSLIKRIGMDARKELEASSGTKIYLELEVEVDPEWQKRFSVS
ncbi:MAG: GTPase Era [Patescibacteria group bacterium]